jgi:hypothetical protein
VNVPEGTAWHATLEQFFVVASNAALGPATAASKLTVPAH